MLNFFKKFSQDEAGAVTVDWVVLCAAVVGLGLAVVTQLGGALETKAASIGSNMAITSYQ